MLAAQKEKALRGVLNKLSSNKNALRTNRVEGTFTDLPFVGMPFQILSEPLDMAALRESEPAHDDDGKIGVRIVITSNVMEVEVTEGVYDFITQSGTRYRVEVAQ